MKRPPLVSIVMSVRNGEKYIDSSIKSILSQSYRRFTFIIINDSSRDRTKWHIFKYKDPRIRYIENKKRLGLTRSLNKGLRFAKGKYIARMDADDFAEKNRLKEQVQYLEDHADIGIVGTWVSVINDNGKKINHIRFPISDTKIRRYLFQYNPIRHSTVIFRKSLIVKYGLYDPGLDGAEDYDLWMRFARHTKLYNLPKYLLRYRVHAKQVSIDSEKKVLLSAVKTRLKAIFVYRYSIFNLFSIIKPVIGIAIPFSLKNKLRNSY